LIKCSIYIYNFKTIIDKPNCYPLSKVSRLWIAPQAIIVNNVIDVYV
jgi:hypothetical protein